MLGTNNLATLVVGALSDDTLMGNLEDRFENVPVQMRGGASDAIVR